MAAYIDPRSLERMIVTFNSYDAARPSTCNVEVVGRIAAQFHGTGSRESMFRECADSVLPLVDKADTEYRHEVRTHLGMTQVLSRLIIRQPNGNYWTVAHYT